MSLRDRDLLSIQEAREAAEGASTAQKSFAGFSQRQVDAIVEACAAAASEAAELLARLAVEETGYGNVADKIVKNRLASVEVPRAIREIKTVGLLREDRQAGILEFAVPVGVVAAVIPSTNPTSTAIYKALIALKARNGIVLSPHPSAIRCICQAAEILARAAERAGAPAGLIGCLKHSSMPGTQELMRHPAVGIILATGGQGLVRAAYGSGKPAYGVGPGNVPAYIERSAQIRKAVADIIAGKTFDYGTICSSEQSIVAEAAVAGQAEEECRQQGAYFLSDEEARQVAQIVFLPGSPTPNTKIVGRAASLIADAAGIKVPAETRVLIAKPAGIGREHPLSAEKLSPILAFYTVANLAAGIECCGKLLHFGGMGHTAAIHSQDEVAVRRFSEGIPAFRICVNTSAVHGSIGYSTNLFPAMTLGCGALGGNITSDNIGPQHLMNIKRVAWESRGVEHRTVPAEQRLAGNVALSMAGVAGTAVTGAARTPTTAQSASGKPNPNSATQASPLGAFDPAEGLGTKATAARADASAGIAAPGQGGARTAAETEFDPQLIGRMVEQLLQQRGIARGAGLAGFADVAAQGRAGDQDGRGARSASSARPSDSALASPDVAVASASAGLSAGDTKATLFRSKDAIESPPAAQSARPPAAPIASQAVPQGKLEVVDFVSENDVRAAISRDQKIYIGPKTIVTPAARDLGEPNGILIETQMVRAGRPASAD